MDKFLAAIGIMILVLGVALLMTFPLMWLINWLFAPTLLVAIYGTSHIGFWQTYATVVIAHYLFRGTTKD